MPQSVLLKRNLKLILPPGMPLRSPVKIRVAPKTFFMDLRGREEFGNLDTWTILPSDVTQTSVCACPFVVKTSVCANRKLKFALQLYSGSIDIRATFAIAIRSIFPVFSTITIAGPSITTRRTVDIGRLIVVPSFC